MVRQLSLVCSAELRIITLIERMKYVRIVEHGQRHDINDITIVLLKLRIVGRMINC